MTTAIKPEILDQVRFEWAVDPGISARQVAYRFQRKYGSIVSERRITAAVAEAKTDAPREPFPCSLWTPWTNAEETTEETLFLIALHHQSRREGGEGLRCHQAAWARRLRQSLEGLEPVHRVLELVRMYASRERAAYYLNVPIRTADLDGFVLSGMWRSAEHQKEYEAELAKGVVPVPFLGVTEAFLKELLSEGAAEIGEEAWDRLSYHPIFHHAFKILTDPSDPLPAEWSDLLLEFLDDPVEFNALIDPAIADTTAGRL
jgi:hypothetical protein